MMIKTTIQLGRSLDPEIIKTLRLSEAGLPDRSYAIKTWYDPIWQLDDPGPFRRPEPSHLSAERRDVEVPLDDRWAVRVPHIAPPYLRQTRSLNAGWVNTISPKYYGTNDDRADAMPSAAVGRSRAYLHLSDEDITEMRYGRQFDVRELTCPPEAPSPCCRVCPI